MKSVVAIPSWAEMDEQRVEAYNEPLSGGSSLFDCLFLREAVESLADLHQTQTRLAVTHTST